MLDTYKTRMIGLPCGEKNYDNILKLFRYRNVTDRRIDGQTDRRNSYINTARQCADAR